nr:Protein F30H5.3 [Haemonchus contortus]
MSTTTGPNTLGPTGAQEVCPRGNPLIYPSTRLPVVCTPGKKSCPIGFACQQSRSSEQFFCCPSRYRMSAFPGTRPCGGFLVLVTRLIGGQLEERCERSCPYEEIEIGGVCYGMGISS